MPGRSSDIFQPPPCTSGERAQKGLADRISTAESVQSCHHRALPAPRAGTGGGECPGLGFWGAPALTSWSSLPCSGAGCGEPGWAGGTSERPGLGAGPVGRSFTLLAGTMPCWPCREQRHQPSSPPAPSLCSTRRTSPRRKDSSWGDSAVLSYSARASWAWWVRWE